MRQFGRVVAHGVYPGIDVAYYGTGTELEHDFVVRAGADAGRIRLRYSGVEGMAVDGGGDLVLTVAGGVVRQRKPVAYQMRDGKREEVAARYVVTGTREVRFAVGGYDKARELVIDPVLGYGTYLGGSGLDEGRGVAVDAAGNLYVTGSTESANFPTVSAFDTSMNGPADVFVMKLNPAGTFVLYSTFIGGSGQDIAHGIAVDGLGAVYVAGSTTSANFPTASAFQGTYSGGLTDAFVLKLNPGGATLAYSTYFGGPGEEVANGIAVDSNGMAAVTGTTNSSVTFPVLNAIRPRSNTAASDAFVARFTATGTGLVFSTLLGGSYVEEGNAVAVDGAGAVYVTGMTGSPDFPLAGAVDTTHFGEECFITKLNGNGTLVYSTFLGGAGVGAEAGRAIVVDAGGAAYVAGITDALDFPTVGGYANQFFGGREGFLAKLNAAGNTLLYSFRFGGSGDEDVFGMAMTPGGSLYITGNTNSSNFPFVNPHDTTNGGRDGFLARFSGNGTTLEDSTLIGTTGPITPWAVAVDGAGAAWVTGVTGGTIPVKNGVGPSPFGGQDAFLLSYSGTSNTVAVGLYTNPPGLTLVVDGATVTAPATVDWAPGSTHTISTAAQQSLSGQTYTFTSWRDEATQTRTVTAPTTAVNYEAFFAGPGCTYTLTPTAISVGRGLQTVSVGVTTGANCVWAYSSTVPWMRPVLSDGRTYVTFEVDENLGAARTGNLAVAGKLVPVTQGISVPPSAPGLVPNAPTGSPQRFTVVATDQDGVSDLARVYFQVGPSATVTTNGCHGFFDVATNRYFLYNDALTGLIGPVAPATSDLAENSQCAVVGALSADDSTGSTSLIFKMGLALKGTYGAATQRVYLWVTDKANNGTGWVERAVWTPASGQALNQAPAVANGGTAAVTGSPQALTAVVSDLNGAADLYRVYFLVNANTGIPPNTCHGFYERATNGVYLYDDGLGRLLGPLTPGTAGTLQNGQCVINGPTTAVTAAGTNLTLTLGTTLRGTFATSPENVYFWARDSVGNDTGWVQTARWNPPVAQQPPGAFSASPTTATAPTEVMRFGVADPNGYGDIYRVYFLINDTTAIPQRTCHGYYEPGINAVFLYNDALNGLEGPLPLGSAGTIGNTQCAIGGAASKVFLASGPNLQFDLEFTLRGGYQGKARNIYLWVRDNAANDTGWIQLATWAPLAAPAAPAGISGGPGNPTNTTTPVTFSMVTRDTNGQGDVARVYFLVSTDTTIRTGGCHGFYDRGTNGLYLYSDDLTQLQGPLTPGTAGAIENGQCAVYGPGSTGPVALNGTDMTIDVRIGRKGSFTNGVTGVYLLPVDSTGRAGAWFRISDWGTLTTIGPPPINLSATPSVANGSPQQFVLTGRELTGGFNISRVYFLVGTGPFVRTNGCHGFYDRGTNALYLYSDDLKQLMGPLVPGTAGTLQNGQCAIDGATSGIVSDVGIDFSLRIGMSRKAGISGVTRVYQLLQTFAGRDSGWGEVVIWNP